jgi:hypothetical protein
MADSKMPASRVCADRADEYRAMAERFQNQVMRERILKVAECWQKMAADELQRELA